jgi:hypothetical protein
MKTSTILIVMLLVSLGFADSVSGPEQISYDTVSNPVQLERFLRNPLWPGPCYFDSDVVFNGLTASKPLFLDAQKKLTNTGTIATANIASGAVTADKLWKTVGFIPDANVVVGANELVIPVTHSLVQKTTGGQAEALTLADGTPGQILSIVLVTDGTGDGTLTPTTCTGFATIVFADAGDQASLLYVNDTIGWIILGTSGVSGPPSVTQP